MYMKDGSTGRMETHRCTRGQKHVAEGSRMCSREVEGWKLGGDEAQMGDVWPVGSIHAQAVNVWKQKRKEGVIYSFS